MTIMKSIPNYGEHMPLSDFYELISIGVFTDYDGVGYYATKTQMSNCVITLTNIFDPAIVADVNEKGFTHVVWFNK